MLTNYNPRPSIKPHFYVYTGANIVKLMHIARNLNKRHFIYV